MEKTIRYIVLVSSVLCNTIARGQYFALSRLFVPILDTFKTTRAQTTLIHSTYNAVFLFLGVPIGLIVQRYGSKKTGAVGTVVVGSSLIASAYAPSMFYLILTAGALHGLGQSVVNLSALSVVSNIFEGQSKFVALSVVSVGPGVSGMIYTYTVEYLLYMYGLRGTLLITGGISLNALPLVLMWPTQHGKINLLVTSGQSQDANHDGDENIKKGTMGATILRNIKHVLGVKSFVVLSFGLALVLMAQNTLITFITDLIEERNMQFYLTSLTIFTFSATSIFGRVVPGFLKLVPHCSILVTPMLSSVFGLAATLFVVYGDTAILLLMGCGLGGLSFGIVTCTMSLAAVKFIGNDQVATGTGLALSLTGIMFLIAGPLNGLIKDTTGSYLGVYYFTAAASFAGGVLLLASTCIFTRQRAGQMQCPPNVLGQNKEFEDL